MLYAQARPQAVPPPAWRPRPCALSARQPPRHEGGETKRNAGDPLAQRQNRGRCSLLISLKTELASLTTEYVATDEAIFSVRPGASGDPAFDAMSAWRLAHVSAGTNGECVA